jgi:hypothetical protein
MPDGEHFITTVLTALPEGSCLGEILLFPEVCTYGSGTEWVGNRLRRLTVAVKNSSADAKEIIVLAVEAGSVRSTR